MLDNPVDGRGTERHPLAGGCTVSTHLSLGATVARLTGYGVATPPKGAVFLQLDDPGVLHITQRRSMRTRTLCAIPITQLSLDVNAVQITKGGNWTGGGYGITGALTGAAMASVANKASHHSWEETRLRATELLPNGARRSVTLTLRLFTPDRLLDTLRPAINTWSNAWIEAVFGHEVDAFPDGQDLIDSCRQVSRMRAQGLVSTDNARWLTDRALQPKLADLTAQIRRGELPAEWAQETARVIHDLRHEDAFLGDALTPIFDLLQDAPSPATLAAQTTERDRLLAQLVRLRQTGAITEHELQAERKRLLGP
jgi:hypothetical protein